MIEKKISQERIQSLNQMIFEMSNLPLEYVLSQSSKIVLTEEWNLSIVEKECVQMFGKVKELINSKMFLEEKSANIFTGVDLKRREILKIGREQKKKVKKLARVISGRMAGEESDDLCGMEEKKKEEPEKVLAEKYKAVLDLFSLMKSNKSHVRYVIPQSKKSTVMHSSHSTCLEKIRSDPGRVSSIPDLVKYRYGKRTAAEGVRVEMQGGDQSKISESKKPAGEQEVEMKQEEGKEEEKEGLPDDVVI